MSLLFQLLEFSSENSPFTDTGIPPPLNYKSLTLELTNSNSTMPESAPLASTANGLKSANDNITRFSPPSRVLSPLSHTLFHNKTRCFV